MLAKRCKIGSKPRIEHVLKKGWRMTSRFFRIKYLPNIKTFSRFSVIVPNSIKQSAVSRNKMRRKSYEAIRKNFALFEKAKLKKTCYDIVAVCAHQLTEAKYTEIERDIINISKKLAE